MRRNQKFILFGIVGLVCLYVLTQTNHLTQTNQFSNNENRIGPFWVPRIEIPKFEQTVDEPQKQIPSRKPLCQPLSQYLYSCPKPKYSFDQNEETILLIGNEVDSLKDKVVGKFLNEQSGITDENNVRVIKQYGKVWINVPNLPKYYDFDSYQLENMLCPYVGRETKVIVFMRFPTEFGYQYLRTIEHLLDFVCGFKNIPMDYYLCIGDGPFFREERKKFPHSIFNYLFNLDQRNDESEKRFYRNMVTREQENKYAQFFQNIHSPTTLYVFKDISVFEKDIFMDKLSQNGII